MTTRPRVSIVLGTAGLAVAVAQALLLSSPPTWFQIAVVAFWGIVGAAYLASGLGQRRRDRLRPDRPRVPDGELSTGGPGEDADVVRRDDVRHSDETGHGTRPGSTPEPVPAGGALDPEATAIVPPVRATPVRAARARTGAGAVVPVAQGPTGTSRLPVVVPPGSAAVSGSPVPVAAGRPAPPVLNPAPVTGGDGSARPDRPAPPATVLPGRPLPAATPGPVPPPTAAESTDVRVSPWPVAATPVTPSPLEQTAAVPAVPATPLVPVPAVPAPAAVPAPVAAEPEVTRALPVAVPEAPRAAEPAEPAGAAEPAEPAGAAEPADPAGPTTATTGPGTSPSFAIRYAGAAMSFGRVRSTSGAHTAGRHAVPEAPADEIAPRRHRHRRPTDTLEQPAVPAGVEAPPAAPAHRHRAPRRRAS